MTNHQYTETAKSVAIWTGGGSLTSFTMLGTSMLLDPPRHQWWMWLLTLSCVLVIVTWGILRDTLPIYRTPRRMDTRQMHHRATAAAGSDSRLRRRARRGASL